MINEEPKCPANNFGKGENYQVPQTDEAIASFEKQWEEWENAHPDDPTGEKALIEYRSLKQATFPPVEDTSIEEHKAETKTTDLDFTRQSKLSEGDKAMFRFHLPKKLHDALKTRVKRSGRRMSPVIQKLIEEYLAR